MNRYLKFGVPVAAILATVVWLGVSSTKKTAQYFLTIPELRKLNAQAQRRPLQVDGHVKEGSIISKGQTTTFVLVEKEGAETGQQLKVVYTGNDMPDTFKEHAEATAVGEMGEDGVFHASNLTAKCASKYEAAPPKLNTKS